MLKKIYCFAVILSLLTPLSSLAADCKTVLILSLEECERRIQPQHQYLVRRHLLNDVVSREWSTPELHKWLKPFCVQCLFSCALEETHLYELRQRLGGGALSELSEWDRTKAREMADSKVKEFFRRYPCADLAVVKGTELWRGTIFGKERVDDQDIKEMVEQVLHAIVVEK